MYRLIAREGSTEVAKDGSNASCEVLSILLPEREPQEGQSLIAWIAFAPLPSVQTT